MTGDACREMCLLVQAELDNELDAAGAAALAGHLENCPGCAALRDRLGALSAQLRGGLTRYAAPPALRTTVTTQRAATGPAGERRRPAWGYSASFGAGLALAAGIASFIILPANRSLVDDSVAAHIRALQPGHLVDVASTDQHTVKPWFDGRLDYAPPVQDFAAQGFPLVGGRLDYLADRPVAALVYRRDKHLIDVFVWPGNQVAADGTVQGYHVVGWMQDGMSYRAVSDVSIKDLNDLVALMRSNKK
jgi:anti-sigma factor RsiW